MLFRSNDTATTEIYTQFDTLSLHDALPVSHGHPLEAVAYDEPGLLPQRVGVDGKLKLLNTAAEV